MQRMKKMLHAISCALLCLSAAFVPLAGTGKAVIAESTKAFLMIAILFCASAFFSLMWDRKLFAAIRKGVLLALLFAVILAISTVKYGLSVVNQQGISFFAVYQMVIFAVYGCFTFAMFAMYKKTVPLVLLSFSTVVTLLIIVYRKHFLYDAGVLRFIAAYSNPNILGMFAALSALASLYLVLEHYPLKGLSIFNISICFATTVLTSSRSAVLALATGLLVVGICAAFSLKRQQWLGALKPAVKLVCILLVLSGIMFVALRPTNMNSLELTLGWIPPKETVPTVPVETTEPSVPVESEPAAPTQPNEEIMQNAWDRFLQRFDLRGEGTSSFKENIRLRIWVEYILNASEYGLFGTDYLLTGRPILNKLVRDPHNTLIYTFFRFGIFGLLALVVLLLTTGLRLLLRKRKPAGQVILLAMLVAISVVSMLNDLLNTPVYFFVLALACAAVADPDRWDNRNEDDTQRVLHVFSVLNKGGAESRTMDILRNIDREKVCFDFAVTSPNAQQHFYYPEIISLGGKVHEIRSWRAEGVFGYFAQWARMFRENGYRIVHCHAGIFSAVPMYAAWLNNIPVRIAHARDSSADSGSPLALKLNKTVTNLFSNKRIYCSKEAAEFAFGPGSENAGNTCFLPNAVDLKVFHPIDENKKAQIKQSLGISDGSLVVGTVGNARPVKNHVFLVKAFHRLLKQAPDAVLLIAGKHEQDTEAKQYVAENGLSQHVLFAGPRDDVPELLQIMDVFVLPSIREGAPGSAVEAQAANVPCILSDTITRAVDVGTGLVSYLSLDESPDHWAEKMLACCNMQRPAFGASIEILANAGYDRQTSSKMLMEIYGLKH